MSMAAGPGVYDDVATVAIQSTNALGVMVAVISGNRGNGFSVQLDTRRPEWVAAASALPEMLREIADQIDDDLRAVQG
jgi:hypothetical protein